MRSAASFIQAIMSTRFEPAACTIAGMSPSELYFKGVMEKEVVENKKPDDSFGGIIGRKFGARRRRLSRAGKPGAV